MVYTSIIFIHLLYKFYSKLLVKEVFKNTIYNFLGLHSLLPQSSYLLDILSNPFSMWVKCLSMNCKCGLYEHKISLIFLRRFVQTKKCSISLSSFLNEICLDGISSPISNAIPPPFVFLSILYGGLNPSTRN